MKLNNADSARLTPCANRLYANVQLAKLNASIFMDGWPVVSSDTLVNSQLLLQKSFFPAICWAASVRVLTG